MQRDDPRALCERYAAAQEWCERADETAFVSVLMRKAGPLRRECEYAVLYDALPSSVARRPPVVTLRAVLRIEGNSTAPRDAVRRPSAAALQRALLALCRANGALLQSHHLIEWRREALLEACLGAEDDVP